MLYRIEINTTPSNIDFSDYVLRIDNVPYKTNNVDKTIIFEGYTFELSSRCPHTITTGTRILFWRDTVLIHIGIVDKMFYDEEQQTYRVIVAHVLSNLKKRNTHKTRQYNGVDDYYTLLEVLLQNSAEVNVNGLSYDLILYKDIIEVLVNEAEDNGLSIDWSGANYYSEPSITWRCYEVGDDTFTEKNSPTVDTSKVYFLSQQINCSGVNAILAPSEFTDEMNADKPSLFTLLTQICIMLGINFVPKNATTFYAVSQRTAMPALYLSDDEIFEINSEYNIRQAYGCETTYSTLDYHLWFNQDWDIPDWQTGISYYEGDYVIYNGQIYRASVDTSEEPTVGAGQYDWYQITVDIEMNYYLVPLVNQNASVQYNHRFGVNCVNLEWMNNFNPLIVNGGSAYFIIPTTNSDYSVAKLLKDGVMASYRRKVIICPASKVISVSMYDWDSIYINDINSDTAEIEINEKVV